MEIGKLIRDSFQGVAMGMMDGLITLLGIVMGVGVATGSSNLVIISGMVGGIANGFGTSIGFYTSENAERGQQIEFYKKKGRIKSSHMYIHTKTEIYMETLFSFLAGVTALIIPISPFFFGIPILQAMAGCLIISITMLFLLGFQIGRLNRESPVGNGMKYTIIGIASAIIALLIGEGLKLALGVGAVQ